MVIVCLEGIVADVWRLEGMDDSVDRELAWLYTLFELRDGEPGIL